MCGIVGILGSKPVAERLIEGLRRLEYRGYDSAGIAVINDNQIKRCRAPGKIINLEERIKASHIDGTIGIAHTRWATHGLPTEENAHPHITPTVAIVHNGIIENYQDLRQELQAQFGIACASETDSEVIAHMLTAYRQSSTSNLEAVFKTLARLEGAYALGIIFQDEPGKLYGARLGSPLAIGQKDEEVYLGSDAIALAGLAESLTYLEDGDVAILSHNKIEIFDAHHQPTARPAHKYSEGFEQISKGPYAHFMLKEIFDQPDALRQTLAHYLTPEKNDIVLPTLPFQVQQLSKISIIACGTSYYAGLVAKYWFERIARIPVEVDLASEFRYRKPPLPKDGLAIFISQSGETADTLAAQKYAAAEHQHTLGIINVPKSSLAREVDVSLMTYAGPEIGVASTKAFSTQLCILALLALRFAHDAKVITTQEYQAYVKDLAYLPSLVESTLKVAPQATAIAGTLASASDMLYLGRGINYPIALEGALKLKEITYIHAEGFAAGEMKHGPIALIDPHVPIVVLAPCDDLYEKLISNVQEAAARQGQIIFISDAKGCEKYQGSQAGEICVPATNLVTSPFVYTVAVQLLAYYTAVHKGTDVDQPRNLAKSVTVE
jgi:glutamine--fructose-6-phosphate transaminase